jgi:hypothetical protein
MTQLGQSPEQHLADTNILQYFLRRTLVLAILAQHIKWKIELIISFSLFFCTRITCWNWMEVEGEVNINQDYINLLLYCKEID